MTKKLWIMALALLLAGGATGLVGCQAFAQEEAVTWPAFAMDYSKSGHSVQVGDTSVSLTTDYRLTHTGHNNWWEDIIASTPVETRWGTFSRAGSYTQVEGTQVTEYDAAFNDLSIETISDDVRQVPHMNFYPIGLEKLESAERYAQEAVRTETTVRVCFDDVCEDNAPGWKFTAGEQEFVYLDDERGIPLTFSGMTVTEVRVTGEKQPFRQ